MYEKKSSDSDGHGITLIFGGRTLILISKRLAQIGQKQWRWHYANGRVQASTTHELRIWHELADGTWQQETMPDNQGTPAPPPGWSTQIKLWTRRLRKLAVTDFQINCQQRSIFLYAPSPKWLPVTYEWAFSWTIPSRGLGPVLGTMCFRQPLPPSTFLMNYFVQLSRTPVFPAIDPPNGPIQFDGRLLLHFLGGTIHHLHRGTNGQGNWRRTPNPADQQHLDLDSGDPPMSEQPLPSPLLPQQLAFIPSTIYPAKPSRWQAIHYDGDQKYLVCLQCRQGHVHFAKFQLADPLYRLFAKMTFMNNKRQLVIGNCATTIPDASLHDFG